MKKQMKSLCLVSCLMIGSTLSASDIGDSVLLWMADTQNTAYDNGVQMTVGDLVSRGLSDDRANGQHVNAARVRVFQGTTALTDQAGMGVYLDLYEQDGAGKWILPTDPSERTSLLSFDFGQTYQNPAPGGTYVGPSWADFGQYADASYSFAIELGFLTGDGDWFTMAYGQIVGYEGLKRFRTSDIVEDPRYTPWSSTYSVPEPSSGLLALMGLAVFALKRQKNV